MKRSSLIAIAAIGIVALLALSAFAFASAPKNGALAGELLSFARCRSPFDAPQCGAAGAIATQAKSPPREGVVAGNSTGPVDAPRRASFWRSQRKAKNLLTECFRWSLSRSDPRLGRLDNEFRVCIHWIGRSLRYGSYLGQFP